MMFNWSGYFTLAQELSNTSTTSPIQEAYLRCAVSRAYYAAFCKAREFLEMRDGYIAPEWDVHKNVIDKFYSSDDATRQHIGELLHAMRSLRNIVDYKKRFYGDHQSRTRGVLVQAEQVLRLLSNL